MLLVLSAFGKARVRVATRTIPFRRFVNLRTCAEMSRFDIILPSNPRRVMYGEKLPPTYAYKMGV